MAKPLVSAALLLVSSTALLFTLFYKFDITAYSYIVAMPVVYNVYNLIAALMFAVWQDISDKLINKVCMLVSKY